MLAQGKPVLSEAC